MNIRHPLDQPSSIFDQNAFTYKAILIVMFLLAALIRRDDIRTPGFAPTREYTSAIFARAYYYAGNDAIDAWRQDIARALKDQQPILEPTVTEFLVSLIFRIMGKEEIWYARYLTNLFWLISAVYFYKLTKHIISADAALFATAYYLFVPMSVIVSRSFQPEALMMMMYMISLYYIIKYFENLSTQYLLLSAILTGTTILIRPFVLFSLLCVFIAISIYKKGGVTRILDRSFIIFISISLIIPFVYYGYGILIADYMRWKVAHSFRPHLFARWEYWKGWLDTAIDVAGQSSFIIALLGFAFLRKNLVRGLVAGLVFGYLFHGLVFNFHIITHNYYQIQIFPIVGICVAPIFVNVGTALKKVSGGLSWIPVVFALLLGIYFSYQEVRNSRFTHVLEEPRVASEIGEIVKHSPRTVVIAYEYGLPLAYYGEFSGTWWPEDEAPLYRPPDEKDLSVQDRLVSLDFQPEFFIITNFDRYYRRHQDLGAYLEENCSIIAQTDQYLIYSSCKPRTE